MTPLLAGTVDHGVCGGRGVRDAQGLPKLPGSGSHNTCIGQDK